MSILTTTLDAMELIIGSVIERHLGTSFHNNRVTSDLGEAKELLAEIRKLLRQRQPKRLTDNELMLEMESRGLIEVVEK